MCNIVNNILKSTYVKNFNSMVGKSIHLLFDLQMGEQLIIHGVPA